MNSRIGKKIALNCSIAKLLQTYQRVCLDHGFIFTFNINLSLSALWHIRKLSSFFPNSERLDSIAQEKICTFWNKIILNEPWIMKEKNEKK